MAVKLSPLFNDAQLDASGNPYTGAKLFVYLAGSTTKVTTYQDSGGLSQHTNPILLNSRGEPPAPIWLTTGLAYKFVLTTPTDTDPPVASIRSIDNVTAINDTSVSIDEWVAGPAPTYVSATSFTLAGDQTSAFHKGRRLKTTNSGGTVYSTIVSSAYAVLTTVTVVNDSGSLDSGLSAVSYGLVSAANPSVNADMVHRKGTAVASAGTTDIWSIAGDFVHITGVVTITSLGTAPYAGACRAVVFDGALTLTHNATTLKIPGGVNITTAANDVAIVRADTTANMAVIAYFTAATGAFLNINGATEDTAPDLSADYLLAYDTSAATIKKVLLGRAAGPTVSTPQATTSGSSKDFTVPTWAKQITVSLKGVSLSGTDNVLVQLGDAGGIETAGYVGATGAYSNLAVDGTAALSAGFEIGAGGGGAVTGGLLHLTLHNPSDNTWVASGVFANSAGTSMKQVGGYKTLSPGPITTVRVTVTAADTFDAGEANVSYA